MRNKPPAAEFTRGMGLSWLVVPVLAAAAAAEPPVPQTVEQLYADFDPRRDPLETRVVREWEEDGLVLRYVVFTVGGFKGAKARPAAFHGFPKHAAAGGKLPALLHMHGGGQRAFLREVRQFAGRGCSGRKAATYTARVALPKAGRQTVEVKRSDFASESGTPPDDWAGITGLILRAADKALPGDKTLSPWKGAVPRMIELRRVGGEPVRRPKPYPAAGASGTSAGAEDPGFQKAIEESVRRERMDGKSP